MKITATSLLARLGLASGLLLAGACGGGPETSSTPARPPASPAQGPTPLTQPSQAELGQKNLPDTAYQVEWATFEVPTSLKAGASVPVEVALKNGSTSGWPSGAGTSGQLYTVRLTHRWLTPVAKGRAKDAKAEPAVVTDYGDHRVELPRAVGPGESITLTDTLQAPAKPGRYLVQFELVHEGVTWFADKGAAKKLVPVTVQ